MARLHMKLFLSYKRYKCNNCIQFAGVLKGYLRMTKPSKKNRASRSNGLIPTLAEAGLKTTNDKLVASEATITELRARSPYDVTVHTAVEVCI